MDIKRFLKQENIGMGWGGFKAVISSASGYASWASLAIQCLTLYYVSKSGIPIWVFIICGLSFILTVLSFEWKITFPSAYKFSNAQQWKHDNPIRIKLEEHDIKFDNQDKKLDLIMEKLNI